MRFADIIGQEELKGHLQNALQNQKVSHAYIISGEEGSGKRMLAEAFAQTLLCEEKGADACGHCHHCRQTMSHNQPDIIYLTHEKPATISVDDIRSQINSDIVIRPYNSDYKVYIVDEAEKMNEQAQNALLKTIEEPPSYAVILLLTTNAQAFLPTIRSRCILLETKPVPDALVRGELMKRYEIPDYQADMSVAFAQGNMGKAIALAQSQEFADRKERVLSLIRHISEMTYADRIAWIREMEEKKEPLTDYLDLLMVFYRDVLLYKATGQANGLIFADQVYQVKRLADGLSYRHLEEIFEGVESCRRKDAANVNTDLILQQLMERMRGERR